MGMRLKMARLRLILIMSMSMRSIGWKYVCVRTGERD